jgi:hypothetical protein
VAVFKSFTQRQKEGQASFSDVFIYDHVPLTLRNQLVRTWERLFGQGWASHYGPNEIWVRFQEFTEEAIGVHNMVAGSNKGREALIEFFRTKATDAQVLDIVDCFVRLAPVADRCSQALKHRYQSSIDAETAVQEVNERLREHQLGYEAVFSNKPYLIRKDNEHVHRDIVLPALRLLHDEAFKGADDEYRKAHRHYRDGNYRDCIANCLSAFESTMKTICDRRSWSYKSDDRAKGLINACLDNGLLPGFMESHLNTIRQGLGDGAPVVRNKLGPHGQGAEIKEVPSHFAEFMLHETAAIILLLLGAYKDLTPLVGGN